MNEYFWSDVIYYSPENVAKRERRNKIIALIAIPAIIVVAVIVIFVI